MLDERLYYFKNGQMNLLSSSKITCKISSMEKIIKKWYAHHPYSKKLNDKWICGDYRIDQQRPQRKVYSEQYLKIVEITEMERNYLDKLIEKIESDIDYPTVWDNGEERHYEKTIYCPKCGKRRKVLTSKTHCEFCGFEFNKAIECEKCGALNLKDNNVCTICGNEFNKKYISKNNIKEFVEIIRCPKCGSVKSDYNDNCRCCNFNFNDKKQCVKCHSWVDEDDNYCNQCGQKLEVQVKCKYCNKKNNSEYEYCSGCGRKL